MSNDAPSDPPVDPLLLAEKTLLESSPDARPLVLSAEAVRQQAKTLTEELTLAMQKLDVTGSPAGES